MDKLCTKCERASLRFVSVSLMTVCLAGCAATVSTPDSVLTAMLTDEANTEAALTRCERVQTHTWPPVVCRALHNEGAHALIFQFESERHVAQYLLPLARDIAWPFCHAAQHAGRDASVLVWVTDMRVRRLDCRGAGEGFSDWHAQATESLTTAKANDDPEAPRIGPLMYALLQRIFEAISKVTWTAQ